MSFIAGSIIIGSSLMVASGTVKGIEASIQKVLEEEKITFNIGKSEFIIFSNELHIVSHQTYVFNEKGILKKNSDNIFDTSNRSNIYVDIYLS